MRWNNVLSWRARSSALLLLIGSVTWAALDAPASAQGGVEVRRTTDGIPHVRADGFHALGFGVGYVQAEDALCTMAEGFVTYAGSRSYFFGAENQPALDSTLGRPKNLDSDLLFRGFIDASVLAQLQSTLPRELNELLDGFAAGYNRYLSELRSNRSLAAKTDCADAAWLRPITREDLYRRMYAAQIAAGYAHFISELANAQPRAPSTAQNTSGTEALRTKLAHRIGEQPALGSNALAFGREATGEEGGVLFGNPHWYWGGPDRFYQMHLTIPGRLDVAGVAFLGVPVVMIGFNEHVAWSHTVSQARRFGLFDLTLDPADRTKYRVDGKLEAMQARSVAVPVRTSDGKESSITRTLYRTRFGPMLDLGVYDESFAWGAEHALAIRDINAENFRVFRNFFYWNQARSLDEFVAIQKREAAVPWVNTLAIGRGDGRVWYSDMGPVPNATDALRAACSTPRAEAFAQLEPAVPVLDASRSQCGWQVSADAVQAGALPVHALPSLFRYDYVANMNDSYWLSNARAPLEGYAGVLGGERQPLSLRGRLGHRIAQLAMRSGSSAALTRTLMREVLSARVHSAELFKRELLDGACGKPYVELAVPADAPPGQDASPPSTPATTRVRVTSACQTLRRWSDSGNAGDRGALLWETMWTELEKLAGSSLFTVPFDSAAPLETPRAPDRKDPRVAQALAQAVTTFSQRGWALNAPLGSQRYVSLAGTKQPLYGGCHSAGYFTVACNDDGSYVLGPGSSANSYLQVVRFTAQGVEAHTQLAHGQREAALRDGSGRAPVARYARKDWLRFPFAEREIARDPELTRRVLQP